MNNEDIRSCIEACFACARDCEVCLHAMMGKKSHNECPACCRECVETCITCALGMSRESRFWRNYCAICAEACRWCAQECGEHEHDHCQKCAESCRKCAELCEKVASR